MTEVTLFHNPACSTSRHALEEIGSADVQVEVVHYLKKPLDRAALLTLIGQLEDPAADLVRKDGFFKELDLNPIGRPKARVAAFLAS
jgi:arsenate reductase (glutaredoxin)